MIGYSDTENTQQLLEAEIETLTRRAEAAESALQLARQTASFYREIVERIVRCDDKAAWWIMRSVARDALKRGGEQPFIVDSATPLLSPKGNYCSICNVHDQHCTHITGESVVDHEARVAEIAAKDRPN